MDLMTTVVFGAVGGVIEERDNFLVTIFGDVSGMVLKAEGNIGTKIKI